MSKPNETKQIKTVTHNGRTVVVSGCWKWGPLLARSSSSKSLPSGVRR